MAILRGEQPDAAGLLSALSHVAYAVADLEETMARLGTALGLEWARPQERLMKVKVGDAAVETTIRFTYSTKGPPHLELIQGEPGTVWAAAQGAHHIGIWVEDLAAAATSLAIPLEVAGLSRSGRSPVGFTYHRSPEGTRFELVDAAAKPAFARWLAGGEFA